MTADAAAVSGGGPVGVQSGDTPAGPGVSGRSGDDGAGVGGVQQAEAADVGGYLGQALHCLDGHGNRHQCRDAWLGT
jgi:hypothetical protein